MSTHAKALQALRNHPRDSRIEQLETLARHHGLKVCKPDGSHVVFQKDGCPLEVSVPAHRPIKPVYITQFIALIDWRKR